MSVFLIFIFVIFNPRYCSYIVFHCTVLLAWHLSLITFDIQSPNYYWFFDRINAPLLPLLELIIHCIYLYTPADKPLYMYCVACINNMTWHDILFSHLWQSYYLHKPKPPNTKHYKQNSKDLFIKSSKALFLT